MKINDKNKKTWKLVRGSWNIYYKMMPDGEFFIHGKIKNYANEERIWVRIYHILQYEFGVLNLRKKMSLPEFSKSTEHREQLSLFSLPEESRFFDKMKSIRCLGQKLQKKNKIAS